MLSKVCLSQDVTKVEHAVAENYRLSGTNAEYSITILLSNDTITGSHSFVTQDGNRIDWCEESSITAIRNKDRVFEGLLHSCYDNQNHLVRIEFRRNNLFLTFLANDHPFLKQTMELHRN